MQACCIRGSRQSRRSQANLDHVKKQELVECINNIEDPMVSSCMWRGMGDNKGYHKEKMPKRGQAQKWKIQIWHVLNDINNGLQTYP